MSFGISLNAAPNGSVIGRYHLSWVMRTCHKQGVRIQFWISSCRFNTCCGVMHRCQEFNNAYSVIEIFSGFIAIWFECGSLIEYHVKNLKERNALYMYLCFCKIWVAQEVLAQIWISLGICLNFLFSKCQIKQEKMMQSTDARLSDYRYSDSGNAKRNFIIFSVISIDIGV